MKQKVCLIILICLAVLMLAACSSQQDTDNDVSKPTITPVSASTPVPTNTAEPTRTPMPTTGCEAALPYEKLDLPEDFEEKAYEHVKNITSFGTREVGTDAEAFTIDYIMNYLEQNGITANKEEFQFQNYNLRQVLINGSEVSCDRLYFNPYDNPVLSGEGEIYYQTGGQHKSIVIQKTSVPLAALEEAINDKSIEAVVITSDEDFQKIHSQGKFQVNIEGNTEEKTSYNVVAKISSTKSDAKDIIISAHMDSIFGVGADDNASGVGALLELAKYYNSMKDSLMYNIILVFYGAEELGLLGAQAYVSEHADELSNCILDFNVDVIGGGKNIFIEAAGGVKGEFSDLQLPDTNIRAVTDYEYGWRLKVDGYCSMIPDWLLKNIKDSCTELNYTFQPGNGMGSDHQVLARYGIPATDITAFGNYVNTAQDTLDKVDSGSMLKAAQIVASVVNKTMLTYSVE